MGKRSDFKRVERDFYPTPMSAVIPLLAHLPDHSTFEEPCAGDGALIDHLESHGHVETYACDIHPMRADILSFNAFDIKITSADFFITNPAWPAIGQKGDPAISLALHLSDIAPTWFLLSADFKHNKYFKKVEPRCRKIVSVGRVKWIPNSKGPGKDNCAWYLFDKPENRDMPAPLFFGQK